MSRLLWREDAIAATAAADVENRARCRRAPREGRHGENKRQSTQKSITAVS